MIKIFLSVRNRLAMTKKCIEALERHTELPYHLYVYNNQTNYRVKEHWNYFRNLYEEGRVSQVTFNTNESTFHAFSKASSFNQWGLQHEMDPKRNEFDFLVCLDSDIILLKKWDLRLKVSWDYVKEKKLKNIKIIGQLPGGIKNRVETIHIIPDKLKSRLGKLGGSALWSLRPNFFSDVGFIPLSAVMGRHKGHDQSIWKLCSRATNGNPYILGLKAKLGVHCGKMSGSVCNRLTRQAHTPEKIMLDGIKFEKQESKLEALTFDEFYSQIVEDQNLIKDW